MRRGFLLLESVREGRELHYISARNTLQLLNAGLFEAACPTRSHMPMRRLHVKHV
jgi:hypothetical protein